MMLVDPAVYTAAGSSCGRLSGDVSTAVESLCAALHRCAGMGGDDEHGTAWAVAYDRRAAELVGMTKLLVDALERFGTVVAVAGYNWAIADYNANPATAKSARPPVPPLAAVARYEGSHAAAPSAVGDNGSGLQSNLPTLLDAVAEPIPNGDIDRLHAAVTAWEKFADEPAIAGLARDIDSVRTTFDHLDSPDARDIIEHVEKLRSAAEEVAAAAAACASHVHRRHEILVNLRHAIGADTVEFLRPLGVDTVVTPAAVAVHVRSASNTDARLVAVTGTNIDRLIAGTRHRAQFALGDDAPMRWYEFLERIKKLLPGFAEGKPPPSLPPPDPKRGVIDESARKFSPEEYRIAAVLAGEGKYVKAIAEDNINRTPDAEVDGHAVEFKSLEPGADNSTIKNRLNEAKKQADRAILDTRGSGMSEDEARRGLARFLGTNARMTEIRIMGDGWDIHWP